MTFTIDIILLFVCLFVNSRRIHHNICYCMCSVCARVRVLLCLYLHRTIQMRRDETRQQTQVLADYFYADVVKTKNMALNIFMNLFILEMRTDLFLCYHFNFVPLQ